MIESDLALMVYFVMSTIIHIYGFEIILK